MVNDPTGSPDPNVTEQLCVAATSGHGGARAPLPSDTVTTPSGAKSTGSTTSDTVTVHVTGCPAVAEPAPEPPLEHCMAAVVARNVTATLVAPQLGNTPLWPGYDALTASAAPTTAPVGTATV